MKMQTNEQTKGEERSRIACYGNLLDLLVSAKEHQFHRTHILHLGGGADVQRIKTDIVCLYFIFIGD